uniref:Uncharacterized protein n=1 Tax=Pseudomonas syringae TaxID=317 RepID=I3W2M5_PSESX|nr:hypothetical protein [Pseudomonas syringae]AFK89852.1 hypothetical protein [Pseudomonas syringae]
MQELPVGISKPHKYIHPVRAGSMVGTYADIAEQAFGGFLDDSLNSAATVGLSSLEAHRRLRDLDERRRLSGIKTVVFAAMAIEAAAFEFAATALGDLVARGDLDKMGLVRKWMTVTERICGQPLDFGGPAIQGLKRLVKARNALVHYKSKPENDAGTVREAMMAEWTQFEKNRCLTPSGPWCCSHSNWKRRHAAFLAASLTAIKVFAHQALPTTTRLVLA